MNLHKPMAFLVIALAGPLSACVDTLDFAYDGAHLTTSKGDACQMPPTLALDRDRYDQLRRERRPGCMAEILAADLSRMFPPQTEPWVLRTWLVRYGFSCDAERQVAPTEYVCRVRRTSRTYGILFGGAPPEEHVWQITYRDVSPVLPSVRVQVSYPDQKDDVK